MSTIKSSAEHLTLNADGASKDIKFQANGVEKASISSAGAFTSTTIDATALTGDLPAISGASLTGISGGKVLQVLSTSKTDTFSTSATSYTDITGLSVNITPSLTSSKILVMMECIAGNDSNVSVFLQMVRDSTAISISDSAGSRIRATAGASDDPSNQFPLQMSSIYLDSPSTTSATTYKIQMRTESVGGNTGNGYLNRSGEDQDNNQNGRYVSSITVMEIGA